MSNVTVGSTAAAAIRQLAQQSSSPGTGIRIASDDGRVDGLTISLIDGPREGDQVVDGVGAPLYLDYVAIAVLDGRTLDANVNDSGAIVFSLDDRQT